MPFRSPLISHFVRIRRIFRILGNIVAVDCIMSIVERALPLYVPSMHMPNGDWTGARLNDLFVTTRRC